MRFKLELEFESIEHLRAIAMLAALLEEGDEAFENLTIEEVDLIDVMNNICCNSCLSEEGLEQWIKSQKFTNPKQEEWWRQTLKVRFNKHRKTSSVEIQNYVDENVDK